MESIPKTGLKGLAENWRSDFLAAISVAFVAMPLSLGVAIASGASPMTGILSAAIGGLVCTFFRGSHLAINGPAAGLIAVILSSTVALSDGTGDAFGYVLAAIVVSGAIQILLGLLKLGKYAELFHSTIIHGILAAIGVIIISTQIHIAMGIDFKSKEIVGTLIDAVKQIPNINPFVGIISLVGLLLLIFQSRISYKLFHLIPAPLWVLILSIPFVFMFDFFTAKTLTFWSNDYDVGPNLLINLPENPMDVIMFPKWNKIATLPFWTSVFSITMLASIISVAGSRAVDKLDPYKRKTNMDKDLIGIGVSTMVSGFLGGLPIITVIVRSSVNVQNHAKTKWSNLYHGVLLVIFIFLLTPAIRTVPLCSLAILLVFAGYKLASPKVLKNIYSYGPEQLIFFMGTFLITLFSNDVLIGVFSGLSLALTVHWLLSMMPLRVFLKSIFDSGSHLFTNKDGSYVMYIKGVANFLATLKIENLMSRVQPGKYVKIDFTEAKLVDHAILANLFDFQRSHAKTGGKVKLYGLDEHASSINNKLALKLLPQIPVSKRTQRQKRLSAMADDHNWTFKRSATNEHAYFESFYFFKSRPIEKRLNTVSPINLKRRWEICDLYFEEGAFAAADEYHTTICVVKSSRPIPKFVIEKKSFTDKYLNPAWHKDIDYEVFQDCPNDFIIKVKDIEMMADFLDDEIMEIIMSADVHHLESNGEAIMIFNDNLRLAQISDYSELVRFAVELEDKI